ncbi:hypothetical protein, partial [Arenibacter amylolyticus]|uniref:hypothetical protein n=1 Tax=Arenibacter amylolyticus TaxID=1406873 RepID=UPI001C3E1785
TLMKGKQHVLSEVNLMMTCYNLRRLMSILGPKELKNRLKGLEPSTFGLYGPFSALWGHFLFRANLLYLLRIGRKTHCTFM